MGTADRKEREREQRISEILDAAERVITKKGYRAVTMDDIAAEAELSKGTLYLYFKSKEGIFMGLDWRASGILAERFQQAVESSETGNEQVRKIGEAYFKFIDDFPVYYQIMTYAEHLPEEIAKSLEEEPLYDRCCDQEGKTLGILSNAILTGHKDGSIDPSVNPLETSILLWAISNGVVNLYKNHGDDIKKWFDLDPSFLMDRFFLFVRDALRPKTNN
ncbi:MAG: TetR/AcrR family transcriptional regulator [Candidatus Zixiibacteriota bacterium]